jgi:hypothetical protein
MYSTAGSSSRSFLPFISTLSNPFLQAIHEKNFSVFGDLTMKDSDSFHEVCHTTQPPIHYLNDVSRKIIQLVRDFNSQGIVVLLCSSCTPSLSFSFSFLTSSLAFLRCESSLHLRRRTECSDFLGTSQLGFLPLFRSFSLPTSRRTNTSKLLR